MPYTLAWTLAILTALLSLADARTEALALSRPRVDTLFIYVDTAHCKSITFYESVDSLFAETHCRKRK
jgi:hypothetical protein